jgi:hypothetical protein
MIAAHGSIAARLEALATFTFDNPRAAAAVLAVLSVSVDDATWEAALVSARQYLDGESASCAFCRGTHPADLDHCICGRWPLP